ncbi:MAG TPA: DUF58 domain-containing protein [Oligoflexia bacterium]|nr:DUF58 domain-containing protein [Oligoflexia bacterium]HMP48963.1 DUF58 domain-containing protein [Oligoflexia bacterium]
MIPQSFQLPHETLKKLQQLRVHLRKAALGGRQGFHKSIRKGHGLEFSEFKAYSPGDDFRSLDWNAYARTDRLYTRIYQEEQDVKVLLILDYSNSLHTSTLAKSITLALAYVTLNSGDRVSLLLPGVHQSAWSASPAAYHLIVKTLENEQTTKENELFSSIMRATSSVKLPGKVFLISDFLFPLEEVEQTLEFLYRKHFECALVAIDTLPEYPAEQNTSFIDSETGETIDSGSLSSKEIMLLKNLHDKHFSELERLARKLRFTLEIVKSNSVLDQVLFEDFIRGGIFR